MLDLRIIPLLLGHRTPNTTLVICVDTVRIDVQKLNSAEAAMACLVMFDVTNRGEGAHHDQTAS